ncbi:hypothetical protein F5887DRAFT_1069407 [Amanita rubescens]|nr:hypothetical protein F5887DRAFT_1069407 [Amanita rubescens]
MLRRYASRILSTLCPMRLQPSDCIDLSGLIRPRLSLPCGVTAILGYPNITSKSFFPQNTRGFLYYYTPPKAPPLAGEVRFRCANSLKDFPNGKDLLSINKFTPWSIPLYALANRVSYSGIREQLMLDDLVSQTMFDKWDRNAISFSPGVNLPLPILYYLRQPVLLPFDRRDFAFYTVTKEKIGVCRTHNLFLLSEELKTPPHSGSGLAQLEPYRCPRRPEKNTVAFRIVKIVEPVQDLVKDYDGHLLRPTEGMLLHRPISPHKVVVRSLDTKSMKDTAMLPINFEDLS